MKKSRLIVFSDWLSADLRDHLRDMERSKLAHVHPDPDEERAVRLLVAWQENGGQHLRVPLDATPEEIRSVVRFLGELADKERGRAEGIRENGGQERAVILRQQARSIALVNALDGAVSVLLTLARPAAPPMPRSTRDYAIIPLSDPTELAVLGWHEAVADATYGSPAWDQDDPRDEIGTRALVSWSSNDEGQRQDYLRIPRGATRPTLEAAQWVVIHAASAESDAAEYHRPDDKDAARLAQRAANALTALASRIAA